MRVRGSARTGWHNGQTGEMHSLGVLVKGNIITSTKESQVTYTLFDVGQIQRHDEYESKPKRLDALETGEPDFYVSD